MMLRLESNIYIKDYQGNIRAVFNQSNNTVVQQTDYYPYGLPKATSFGAEVNPFKYGGKELNTNLSLTFYDFEARMLLTELCMFQRPDPMAGDYTWLNPYTYCAGDPINNIDPDGNWSIDVHLEKDRSKNGYGIAVLYDKENNELYRFEVRAEGIAGHDRMKENADTPLGRYVIPKQAWIVPNAKTSRKDVAAYGQYPRLVMIGESGEIKESGRSLIRIHGGRQEHYNEDNEQWEPDSEPSLKKTKGCIRAFDADMKILKVIVDEIETVDQLERPQYVNVIDDLDKFEKDDK